MKVMLETRRFLLREVCKDDLDNFWEIDSDPAVHRFLGNRPHETKNQVEKDIENLMGQYAEFGIGRWAVVDKLSDEALGWAGLKYELNQISGARYYDLGYRLKQKHWGKGVATETAAACLKYGFEVMNLDKIQAVADIENTASNRVLQKIGMKKVDSLMYYDAMVNWYLKLRNE